MRLRLVVGLILAISVIAIESLAVAIAMPAAVRDFGELYLYGWAFSVFFLAMTVGMALGGSLADRRGTGVPFFLGGVLFAVGLLLGGSAMSLPWLIVARGVQGLGGGLTNAATYAIIARHFETTERPRMLALISSAWAIPSLIGPGWAAVITTNFGWRWVFLCLAPLPMFAVALVSLSIRNRPLQEKKIEELSATGLLKSSLFLSAGVAIGLASISLRGWSSYALFTIPIGIGICILAARGLIRARRVAYGRVLVTNVVLNLAFFGLDAFLPLCIVIARGEFPMTTGAALTAGALGWISASWFQSRFVDRFGPRSFIAAGVLLVVTGIFVAAASLRPDVPVLLSVVAVSLKKKGMGLASNTISLVAMEIAETGRQGEDTAVVQLAGVHGMAIGCGMGGFFLGSAKTLGDIPATHLITFCLLLAVLLIAVIPIVFALPVQAKAVKDVP